MRLKLIVCVYSSSITKFPAYIYFRDRVMVLKATFNNISVISWWSVLLVGETGVPRKNQQPAASH